MNDVSKWVRREDGALKCPNCRRWALNPSPHLDGLCMPPDQRRPQMVRGKLFGSAMNRDIALVREALERRGELTKEVAWKTLKMHERRFRAAVSALRLEGYPVVSFSEKGSKYRKALDRDELEEFIRSEIESRSFELLAQAKALRDNRHRWLPPLVDAEQTKLDEVKNTWSND